MSILHTTAITLIVGLIIPLTVTKRLIHLDVPIMIAVSVLLYLLALDGAIGRWDGLLLFAGVVGYTLFTVLGARRNKAFPKSRYLSCWNEASSLGLGRC
jgi:cation:H+ antiporter